jgi:hypothetical protein
MGHGEAGLQLDRPLDLVAGVVEALERIKEPGQVVMGELEGEISGVFEGLPELRFGLVRETELLVDGPEIVAGSVKPGLISMDFWKAAAEAWRSPLMDRARPTAFQARYDLGFRAMLLSRYFSASSTLFPLR